MFYFCASSVDNTSIALSLMGPVKGFAEPQKTGDLNIVLSGMSVNMGSEAQTSESWTVYRNLSKYLIVNCYRCKQMFLYLFLDFMGLIYCGLFLWA